MTVEQSRAPGEIAGDVTGAGARPGPGDLVGLLSLDLPAWALSSPGGSRRPETPGEESGGQSGAQAVLHTGAEYPGLLQTGQCGKVALLAF